MSEFKNDFLELLLGKILMGDFNMNFLNCNIDKNTSDYVDIL